MSLTPEEREAHACCMKRHLCKDEHFHERDIERIVAAHVAAALTEAAEEVSDRYCECGYMTGLCTPCSMAQIVRDAIPPP